MNQIATLLTLSFALVGSTPALAGEGLLFLDDFGKPLEEQRNPYEERIETERHDFTQSTKTVGVGVVQVESGYTYFYKDKDAEIEQSHSLPEMLVRIGVSEDIELRIRPDYIWRFIDEAENASGLEDLQLGIKLRLTDNEGLLPESAIELGITVPTGSPAWSTERVQFGMDFIYGWKLCELVELYGSTGIFQNAFGDFGFLPEEPAGDRFTVVSQSVALGFECTERSTMYTEFFGIFSHNLEDDVSVGVFNIGIDYYLTDNFVVDIRSGVGLTPDSDDFFVGVGGGYRF